MRATASWSRPAVSESIADERERLARDPDTARIFLPGGAPPAPGTVFSQPDLARTLEAIRDRGEDGFYRGRVARDFADGQKQLGGLITRGDLARYDAKLRGPCASTSAGAEIITTPAPVLGPGARGDGADRRGDRAETSSARATPLRERTGSPRSRSARSATATATSATPPSAASTSAASPTSTASGSSRRSINPHRATPTDQLGLGDREKPTTTHFSVIDRQGMAVSVTTTLNDSFGNARVAPGLGFLLNNEMDDFATRPGQKNMYGLVQGSVNAVAPGKRMLSSMCPSIAVDHGRTVLVWGTPGGSTIPTTNLQVLFNRILLRRGRDAAVAAARFHQQDLPDAIQIEKGRFDAAWIEALQKMGHTITDRAASIGRVHAIAVEADGTLTAVADPRGGGAAVVVRRVAMTASRRRDRAPETFRPLYREGRRFVSSISGCSPATRSGCAREGARDRRGDPRHGGARRAGHRRRRGLRRGVLAAQRRSRRRWPSASSRRGGCSRPRARPRSTSSPRSTGWRRRFDARRREARRTRSSAR